MPIERVTAVNREPSAEEGKGQGAPVALQNRPQAARSREIRQARHDEADLDVPVRRGQVERTKNEKCNSASQRSKLPGAKVLVE